MDTPVVFLDSGKYLALAETLTPWALLVLVCVGLLYALLKALAWGKVERAAREECVSEHTEARVEIATLQGKIELVEAKVDEVEKLRAQGEDRIIAAMQRGDDKFIQIHDSVIKEVRRLVND